MGAISLNRLLFGAITVVAASATMGCGSPLGLQAAFDVNFIDTLTINALTGTDIGMASAYDVAQRIEARTERGDAFDFAFDIDTTDVPLVFPPGALGLGSSAGILNTDAGFDEVDEAPRDDYVIDRESAVEVGSVFIVRSRAFQGGCAFFIGALPRYGKFRVLSIDIANRQIVLQALVNINCGYRGLEEGLPTR